LTQQAAFRVSAKSFGALMRGGVVLVDCACDSDTLRLEMEARGAWTRSAYFIAGH
jgi:hypothetical protein